MAQLVKVPYFTVDKYGRLTQAGEVVVSVPDGTSWNEITGKPETFPPSPHTHTIQNGGGGQSVVLDGTSMLLKSLSGSRAASVLDNVIDLTVDVPYPYSAGVVDPVPPGFTDNGDGTGTFAGCNVALFNNSNYVGTPEIYPVAEATLSFVEGQQEYAVIDYNGGSPIWRKETDSTLINGSNITLVYIVWRQPGSGLLHSSDQDSIALGLPNKINSRILNVQPYAVSTMAGLGVIASETTSPNPRTILVSAGTVYKGVVKEEVLAFDSSTDLLTKAVYTGSGWSYTTTPVYDNLHFNPYTGGESVLTNNKYAFRLYFRSVGDVKETFYVESPDQYNTEALARTASEAGRNDLPVLLTGHCILVGRSIIQKSATSGITEAFARIGGTFFSGIPKHNDLLNIQGGLAPDEFYHLTAKQHTDLVAGAPMAPTFMLMGA